MARCPKRRVFGKAGTARGGVPGGRCSVCGLRAGVRCCAHLRWPTPVRPAPDSRVKGWDFQMLGERISRADSQCRPDGPLSTLRETRRHQESGRRQASSRDSLPASNAAAVVQEVKAIQRILRKRAAADRGVRQTCDLRRRSWGRTSFRKMAREASCPSAPTR